MSAILPSSSDDSLWKVDEIVEESDDPLRTKILWSCVARNDTVLAEAGDDYFDGAVARAAQGLLAKKVTPGFEYYTSDNLLQRRMRRSRDLEIPTLKGMKFHIHEHDGTAAPIVWVLAAVYNPQLVSQVEIQSFLEKLVGLTEIWRESDPAWRRGPTLAAQADFAPILLQRMTEVTYLGKLAMVSERLESTKALMQSNIERILEREERLEDLNTESTKLQEMASVFKKKAKRVRRMKMMQDAKHGLILGGAITAGVAVIVVPPLVAIL